MVSCPFWKCFFSSHTPATIWCRKKLAEMEAPHVAQWAGLLQNWLTYIGWL